MLSNVEEMAEGNERSTTPVTSSNINPPIIMKIDGPPDDNTIKGHGDEGKSSIKTSEDFKTCTPSFRPPSSNNPFASAQTKSTSRGILKPPQLSLNNTNCSSFTLNPSKLNVCAKSSTDNNEKPFVLNPSRLNPIVADTSKSQSQNSTDNKQTVQNGETLKFVPLLHSDNAATSSNSSTSSTMPCSSITASNSFVFGQNLQDRVLAESKSEEPKASTSNVDSNGTSEMLFSSVIKQEIKTDASIVNKETKTLSESAREYEESRAVKRKYEEVEVITGEEEETNILSMSCKLFAYDKNSGSWQERGRGTLRLNDYEVSEKVQSRIVFRTSGSLRVVLNTKIWAEMTVEKASEKSIRLTALDPNGEVRVFLIMASIEDANKLFSQLEARLDKEISAQKRKKDSDSEKN